MGPTDGGDVKDLQGDGPGLEIAARTSLFASLDPKQPGVEWDCLFEIADFDVQSEELRNILRGRVPRRFSAFLCDSFFCWHDSFSLCFFTVCVKSARASRAP